MGRARAAAVYVCVCVCQVTHNQLNVLDLSWLEEGAEIIHEELEPLSRNMAASLRQLIDQRDKASEVRSQTHLYTRVVSVTQTP